MGTTIRRQPVVNNIPKNPDYYFQNIVNFGGMNISSNPFETEANTASDCYNVYVDEDNALSTRPRLSEKYNLMKYFDGGSKLIDIYNVHNGYLIHLTHDNEYYANSKTTREITTSVQIGNPENFWTHKGRSYQTVYVSNTDDYKTYLFDESIDDFIEVQVTGLSNEQIYYNMPWTDPDGIAHVTFRENDDYVSYVFDDYANSWTEEPVRGLNAILSGETFLSSKVCLLGNVAYYLDSQAGICMRYDKSSNRWYAVSFDYSGRLSGQDVFNTKEHSYHLVSGVLSRFENGDWTVVNTSKTSDLPDFPEYGRYVFVWRNIPYTTIYSNSDYYFCRYDETDNNWSLADNPLKDFLGYDDFFVRKENILGEIRDDLLRIKVFTHQNPYEINYVSEKIDNPEYYSGDALLKLPTIDETYTSVHLWQDYTPNSAYLYFYEMRNGSLLYPVLITGDTPFERCNIFEQNEIVYLTCEKGYKKIESAHISDVEGYVPTLTVGKYKKSKNEDGISVIDYNGNPFESLNLLSNKYKESYFWKGEYNLGAITNDEDSIENDYLKSRTFEGSFGYDRLWYVLPGYPDTLHTISNSYVSGRRRWVDHSYDLNTGNHTSSEITLPNANILDSQLAVSEDGTMFALRVADSDSHTYDGVWLKEADGAWTRASSDYLYGNDHITGQRIIAISNERDVIACANKTTATTASDDLSVKILIRDGGGLYGWSSRSISLPGSNSYKIDGLWINNGYCYLHYEPTQNSHSLAIAKITDTDFEELENVPLALGEADNIAVGDNSLCVISYDKRIMRYRVDSGWDILTESNFDLTPKNSTDTIWFNDGVLYTNNGYFDADDNFVVLAFGNTRMVDPENVYSRLVYGPLVTQKYICSFYNYTIESTPGTFNFVQYWHIIEKNYLTSETDVSIINELRSDSKEYDYNKWLARRDVVLNAKITTRFRNERWFAYKNKTVRTINNDPTYIGYNTYNENGDSNEDITGMNQISDNVLMLYKPTKLFIVTYGEVANSVYDYLYTETKSLEGNIPINAPIVTVLNELPTFVNYNGIYRLSQLENVQSSDRIAELLSEAVNPKWLKEPKDAIDSCKTINRLYWTYYILNDIIEENGDTFEISKVYLYDNRTNQWFYWELPIKTINVFVKDNKTTFVDEKGKIYQLETTDLINEYNPEITEYYDTGKKLIKWHWQSQILPLKTINYSKKLIDTTFILTDTDTQDNYGLNYQFTAYRRNANMTSETTISDDLNYVQSTTKRTLIPRFNFIQIKLSNVEDEDQFDNNKLKLVGLAMKYVLLNYNT